MQRKYISNILPFRFIFVMFFVQKNDKSLTKNVQSKLMFKKDSAKWENLVAISCPNKIKNIKYFSGKKNLQIPSTHTFLYFPQIFTKKYASRPPYFQEHVIFFKLFTCAYSLTKRRENNTLNSGTYACFHLLFPTSIKLRQKEK